MHVGIGVRDGGQGGGAVNQLCHRTEQVSIYLGYVSGRVTKETFIEYYSTTVNKIGSAIVHYYFFSLAGPRDKHFAFAIRQNSV